MDISRHRDAFTLQYVFCSYRIHTDVILRFIKTILAVFITIFNILRIFARKIVVYQHLQCCSLGFILKTILTVHSTIKIIGILASVGIPASNRFFIHWTPNVYITRLGNSLALHNVCLADTLQAYFIVIFRFQTIINGFAGNVIGILAGIKVFAEHLNCSLLSLVSQLSWVTGLWDP